MSYIQAQIGGYSTIEAWHTKIKPASITLSKDHQGACWPFIMFSGAPYCV